MNRCVTALISLLALLGSSAWAEPRHPLVLTDSGGQTDEPTVYFEDDPAALYLTEQTGTPTTPATGFQAIYPKDDDLFYHQLDDGTENPFVSGDAFYSLARFFDGSVIETIDIDIIEDSGTVYLTLQADGGGDLTFQFAGMLYTLDCTPIQQVALTAGTDASPAHNFVYVTESGGALTLNASTSGFPSGSPFSPISKVVVPTAARVASNSVYKNHAWTDHINRDGENGHLQHINAKLRSFPAGYESGVAPSDLSVSSPDAYISTTAGVIYQLHPHAFPAFDMSTGDPVYVTNHTSGNFTEITSFDDIDEDASGNSVNNKYLNIVLLGIVSENESESKLMMNLPIGVYNNAADALADVSDYTVYSFPDNTVGTAFLIARYTVQGKTSGAWVQVEKVDLRGVTPSVAGFAGASISSHSSLIDLGADDHTQYALLAGRSGGQTLVGGTGASENLTLESTSNATKGHVVITGGKLTSADSTHTGTEMLGFNAVASGNDSVVIGQSADVGPNGVVIGQGAAGGDGAVVIGQGSGNGGTQDAVIIGLTATGTDGSIALGLSADATGGNVAIGSGAVADGAGSIAIGGAADAGHASAIAFGSSATTTAANQLVVEGITTAYLGDGVTDTSPSAMAVYATGGSGANIDGADLTIGGGASTGNGNGGRVFLSVTPPGASGSSANSYTTGLEIEADADGRFYQDLQIDGLTTATGLIDAVAGVFIDTTGQFQISNGTHQVEVYPSGTEMIVDSDGATMNTLKVSDLDVNVLTGDLTVTAGDATVTAGDVLVTAGGVGIRSGAPATLLHVDNGGTTPTLSSGTVALFQNTSAGNSLCSVSIAGGSATNGTSRLNFGTWWDEDNGYISYEMLSKAFTFRTNGSSSTKGTYDNSGNLTIPGDFQAGNSSNTRWANVPMIGGHITGAWVQNITTTNYRYTLAASNTGDILLDAPSSIHGSKIKAVRAYFQLSGASAGSLTANVAFYEPTGGSTGSATASSGGAVFTTDISQTVTATAGTSGTTAAGEQCLIRVWVSANSSDGTFYLNSVEIQYEEREY